MKKKKFLISILLVVVLIFGRFSSVYADVFQTVLNELFNAFQDVNQGTQQASKNFIKKSFDSVGFLIDESGILIQKIKDAIHGVDNSFDSTNSTDSDVADWITSNVTVVDGDVVFGTQYNNFIKEYAENFVDDNISYAYSFSKDDFVDLMNLQEYNLLVSFLNDNENDNYIFLYRPRNNPYVLFTLDKNDFPEFYLRGINSTDIYKPDNVVYGRCTNAYDSSAIDSDDVACYQFDSSNNDLVSITPVFNGNYVCGVLDLNITKSSPSRNDVLYLVTKSGGEPVRYKYGLATAQDILYQPYYYNNSVWNDFSNHSGDYTVDNSNVNTVTYNDTKTYIDSFNTNNGYPPTPQDININIENQNNNNNSGGGGSGGGDNGGGSGGSGDSDGIFDFLSDLGSVLGNLIKNVGQAFTNIIKGISDLISSIVTDLPTVFFDFIGSLFGWLPDEWVTLLSLSLAAMLIWGIVKVIRG